MPSMRRMLRSRCGWRPKPACHGSRWASARTSSFPTPGSRRWSSGWARGLDGSDQDGESLDPGGRDCRHRSRAKRTAAAGWAGIHKMVGVPGSVGGGIVMNAGCHGVEWRDTVVSVLVLDAEGQDRVVPAAEAGFAYRRSALGHVVVLETTVALVAEDPARLEEEIEGLAQLATRRHALQPALLRLRLQESGPARPTGRQTIRAPVVSASMPPASRGSGLAVSRSHRCTPTTS